MVTLTILKPPTGELKGNTWAPPFGTKNVPQPSRLPLGDPNFRRAARTGNDAFPPARHPYGATSGEPDEEHRIDRMRWWDV